jgi:hypothetical protein
MRASTHGIVPPKEIRPLSWALSVARGRFADRRVLIDQR